MQFITDRGEYHALLARIEQIIDLRQRFPDQVFRSIPQRLVIVDYDLLWNAIAWQAYTEMAQYYGDSSVVMVGNPLDPDDWIADGFGHLGAARLSIDESGESFRRLVWGGDPFESLVDQVVISSDAAGFAIWGERDPNVAVIGFYDRKNRPAREAPVLLPELTMDDTFAMLGLQFVSTKVPPGYMARMRFAYEHGSEGGSGPLREER